MHEMKMQPIYQQRFGQIPCFKIFLFTKQPLNFVKLYFDPYKVKYHKISLKIIKPAKSQHKSYGKNKQEGSPKHIQLQNIIFMFYNLVPKLSNIYKMTSKVLEMPKNCLQIYKSETLWPTKLSTKPKMSKKNFYKFCNLVPMFTNITK